MWAGHVGHAGYGIMGQGPGRPNPVQAHRWVWSLLGGELPEHLHHICRTKTCVRPDHLAPMTASAHKIAHERESRPAGCVNGHPFTEANTYVRTVKKSGRTTRQCRACKAARERGRKAAMPAVEKVRINARGTALRRARRAAAEES